VSGVIGVAGAGGAVGTAAVRELYRLSDWQERLAGRDVNRIRPLAQASPNSRATVATVDLRDPDQLDEFCRGCQIVLNCAGPSAQIRDSVALAALKWGAHYVDAAGDDVLHGLLTTDRSWHDADRTAMVAAGLTPGLSGLLPRYLAARAVSPPAKLVGYAGGRDTFTRSAAIDYLAALHSGYGEPFAAWIGGSRRSGALKPVTSIGTAEFDRMSLAQPYFSTELERCARELGLQHALWYSVFDGVKVPAALRRLTATGVDPCTGAPDLCRAAADDASGLSTYQLVVLELTDSSGRTQSASLRGRTASGLTGALAAIAVRAVQDGTVPPGVSYAADVLDPATAVDQLADSPEVLCLRVGDEPVITPVAREASRD
jgi:hypothetical protein